MKPFTVFVALHPGLLDRQMNEKLGCWLSLYICSGCMISADLETRLFSPKAVADSCRNHPMRKSNPNSRYSKAIYFNKNQIAKEFFVWATNF